jgi:hypothetical protein
MIFGYRDEHRPQFVAALLLSIAIAVVFSGCATVGTGDPVIVRAEDVQVNSLNFYDTAMQWHYANSTKESPALYRAFEKFRVDFPPAYRTLTKSIAAYKSGKGGDLQTALAAVEQLLLDIKAIWTPPPVSMIPSHVAIAGR